MTGLLNLEIINFQLFIIILLRERLQWRQTLGSGRGGRTANLNFDFEYEFGHDDELRD